MKRQRTITQMREKGKTPENQLSNEEILSLQEKDFRLLMLKMMQDIGNKLEAKMDNLQETLSKEIQDIKLKQEEMQNTITEIKNSPEAANSRIQEAEERISEVEDRLVEIMDAEQKARSTYDNLIRLTDDPDILDPLRFLREREIVHFQRFGEALSRVQDRRDSKNFYAFNPDFDKK